MWQMGCINFIVDLTVINLTQLASRGVSRHLAGSIAANHNGQMGDIFHFWWLRLKPIIFPCLCECLTHWIISLINKTSLPRHNVFGSRCGMKPRPSVEKGSLFSTLCVHVLGEFSLFLSTNIVTNNVTNLSLMLQALAQINLAHHTMFSPPVAFCLPLLTSHYSFSLLLPCFPSHCPLTCILLNRSFFHSSSFLFLILNISHVPTSSTYQPPLPASSSIAHFISPSFSPRHWAHPGSLGPLKCIISSKRYPSALTSVLAGCLPSPLNGLINPSWFLDGLDFIVSHSPLSSCSSLILNVILSDFNMSAFSEHTAFDYIELE